MSTSLVSGVSGLINHELGTLASQGARQTEKAITTELPTLTPDTAEFAGKGDFNANPQLGFLGKVREFLNSVFTGIGNFLKGIKGMFTSTAPQEAAELETARATETVIPERASLPDKSTIESETSTLNESAINPSITSSTIQKETFSAPPSRIATPSRTVKSVIQPEPPLLTKPAITDPVPKASKPVIPAISPKIEESTIAEETVRPLESVDTPAKTASASSSAKTKKGTGYKKRMATALLASSAAVTGGIYHREGAELIGKGVQLAQDTYPVALQSGRTTFNDANQWATQRYADTIKPPIISFANTAEDTIQQVRGQLPSLESITQKTGQYATQVKNHFVDPNAPSLSLNEQMEHAHRASTKTRIDIETPPQPFVPTPLYEPKPVSSYSNATMGDTNPFNLGNNSPLDRQD